jgi:FMN phosphatase YigB (HAD superfamily)
MTVEAVTFDFWNTLVREDPTVWDRRSNAWRELLAERGHVTEDATLKAAFDAGWHAYVANWNANAPFGAVDALKVMLTNLGVSSDGPLTDALLAVLTDPPTDRYPTLNPNLLETLGALRDADVKVGIVCDVGLTPSRVLRRYLDQQGALELFDHWSFSDDVGVYKPDAKIFHHALAGLGGVSPERAAHIGDLRRTDIVGAQALGITAVRYTGVYDDPVIPDSPIIEGDHVIADHAELPAILGLT